MRIDDVNRAPQTGATDRSQLTSSRGSADGKSTRGVDRTDLSALAQGLGGTDDKRLESLRAAVESGAYRVSSSALAGALIDFHLK